MKEPKKVKNKVENGEKFRNERNLIRVFMRILCSIVSVSPVRRNQFYFITGNINKARGKKKKRKNYSELKERPVYKSILFVKKGKDGEEKRRGGGSTSKLLGTKTNSLGTAERKNF